MNAVHSDTAVPFSVVNEPGKRLENKKNGKIKLENPIGFL
jgi:hypothetical protein